MSRRCIWLLVWPLAASAAVCDPRDFTGAYGFSLTGTTDIGNAKRPAAAVGRVVLDGSGGLSGVSSVAFTGIVLGNPVTGSYSVRADCSVTWSLQDDSGAFQHFEGTMEQGGRRVTFRQTDAGGARKGLMLRTPATCSDANLVGEFDLSVTGSTVDVQTAAASGAVSISGLVRADGAGGLSYARSPAMAPELAGTYEVHDDCFADIVLTLPAGRDQKADMRFRAVIAEGRNVLGIQTDPGNVVSLRLGAK